MTEENLDRRTVAIAAAILIVTTTAGMFTLGSVGLVVGPLVDRFITTRLLASRGYASPGPPLWSAVVGGVALLPAMAAGDADPQTRDQAIFLALSAALGAIVLGAFGIRSPHARLGAIGIGLGIAAFVVAVTLHGRAA
jgi:hypothetical protein